MMRKAAASILLAGVGVVAGAQAAPEHVDMRVTEELSTGSFGDPAGLPMQETALRLRYRAERWTAQAEVPWLRVIGAQGAPLPPGARTDQGPGDLRVRVAVPLRPATPASTGLDLVLRMRGGLGTPVGGVASGESGQAVHLRMQRPIGDWTAFGHVGLRRAGDLPGTDPGRHAWVGEIGASRQLTQHLEAGAFVDVRQRMDVSAALPEASLYAAIDSGDWRWDFFVSRVFNRSYEDVTAGIALRGKF
jgi:hypothetical protein